MPPQRSLNVLTLSAILRTCRVSAEREMALASGCFDVTSPGSSQPNNTATNPAHCSREDPLRIRRTSLAKILGHYASPSATSRSLLPELNSTESPPHLRELSAGCSFIFLLNAHKKSGAPAPITDQYGSPYGNQIGPDLVCGWLGSEGGNLITDDQEIIS